MEPKSMIIITKNNVILKREALELLLAYTRYYIDRMRRVFGEHQRELKRYRDTVVEATAHEDVAMEKLQREIATAEAIVREGERLRIELATIYRWNFVKLAEVLRKARIHLHQDKIQNMHSLNTVLEFLIAMLHSENPKFSREKFITYINEER